MAKETEREEIKEEAHELEDEAQDELDEEDEDLDDKEAWINSGYLWRNMSFLGNNTVIVTMLYWRMLKPENYTSWENLMLGNKVRKDCK